MDLKTVRERAERYERLLRPSVSDENRRLSRVAGYKDGLREKCPGVELGMVLDRDRGICKLNDSDRQEWINNDEGLYNWQRRSRQSMKAFIKTNKAEIDQAVCAALNVNPRSSFGGARGRRRR